MRPGALLLLTSLAAPAAAGDFVLDWPVDCTLGETCHIQQYVDHDPGPGAQDFLCNGLSYDGHKGTDIALPYISKMEEGVLVRAAASGVVRGWRDGMDDRIASAGNAADIEGRECGNGVVLRHENGWETQYCHLKRGTVRVRDGMTVAAGAVLGEIGLSGKSQFPHLHLSVRKDGAVVDPFAPDAAAGCGAADAEDLWAIPVPYAPGGFLGAGFSPVMPEYSTIKAGTAHSPALPADAGALVFWAYAYGGRAGDRIELAIAGPDGAFVAHEETLDKAQAQYFRAAGRRLGGEAWPRGSYTGTAVLRRDGQEAGRIVQQLTIN